MHAVAKLNFIRRAAGCGDSPNTGGDSSHPDVLCTQTLSGTTRRGRKETLVSSGQDLRNRVAVVTGASAGVGRAIVHRFVGRRNGVFFCVRRMYGSNT